MDSQTFAKFTVELVLEAGSSERATEANILRSFYVRGSTGHVGNGQFVRGDDAIKSLKLDGMSLVLEANVPDGNGIKPYSISCRVRVVKVEELTPWDGKPNGRWQSFAPAQ